MGCEGLWGEPSWTQVGPARTGKEFRLFSQLWVPKSQESLNPLSWAPCSGRRAAGRARGDLSVSSLPLLPGTPLTRACPPAGAPPSPPSCTEGAHSHLRAWPTCCPYPPHPVSLLVLCLPLPVTVFPTTSHPDLTPEEGTWGAGAELILHSGFGNQE